MRLSIREKDDDKEFGDRPRRRGESGGCQFVIPDEFLATVIRELPQATVSLQQAVETSQSEGNPISAEFDVEDGELQISVYTSQGDHFDEVTIDPKSGSIKNAKPLSDAKEIGDAQAQS